MDTAKLQSESHHYIAVFLGFLYLCVASCRVMCALSYLLLGAVSIVENVASPNKSGSDRSILIGRFKRT